MNEDAKLQRLMALFDVANRDTVTADDISEVIQVVLTALVKVKEEADTALSEARRESSGSNKRVDDAVKQGLGEANKTIVSHRKLIDKLLSWKESQDGLSTKEDIDTALEIGWDNEKDIARIRGIVDSISKKEGPPGKRGRMPRHKWEGTVLYIEQPDGNWDEGVDLQGIPGELVHTGPNEWGSGMTDLQAGSANVTIRNNKIYVTTPSGSSLTIEVPPESPDDSRVNFTFSTKPLLISMNGSVYRENHGWTWNGTDTATMFAPVGTPAGPNGDIYALIQI